MKLTRRDLSKLALGTALAAPAAPAAAFFHKRRTPESIGEQLARDLTARLKPECNGSFSVPLVEAQDVPFWTINAVVQLNWPPGLRRHPFASVGQDGDEAYAQLLTEAEAHFNAIWTMPDGSGCFV